MLNFKFLTGILLIALGLFLAFGLTELIVRFYLHKTRVISDKDCRQEDYLLHHSLIPDSNCRSKTKEWDVEFKVNSLGLRDYEYTKEKPQGVFRILMLGDSFTEGYGVELEEIFPKLLEKKLNTNEKKKIEIINAGITGYSPTLSYLWLQEYGLDFNPDLVVFNFSMTDFYDDLQYKKKLLIKEERIAEIKEKEVEQIWAKGKLFTEEIPTTTWIPFISTSVKWWLHKNFASYDFVVLRLKTILNPDVYKDNIISFEKGDIQNDQFAITREEITEEDYALLLENSEGAILKIKQLLDSKDVNFLLVIIPYGHQINDKEWGNGRNYWQFEKGETYSSKCIDDLVGFAKKENIASLNLLPDYQKTKKGLFDPNYYFSFDGHWNYYGHQLAAEKIYQFLQSYLK